MQKVRVISEVQIPTIGKVTHTQDFEFADNENVFGKVLAYREEMKRLFPGCDYRMIKAIDAE